MFRQLFIISFLLFLFSFRIDAQQQSYVFQHLTSKDGLASDNVTCIFQDSKGFYWLGTENGLQKFDGKNFTPASSFNGFRNARVTTQRVGYPVLEDKQGDIWMHHAGFISVYHPRTGQINRIEIADDSMHPASPNIQNFCKDEQGNMWIVTGENIYKYDSHKSKLDLWLQIEKISNRLNPTHILYDVNKKALWLARERDISMIDIITKKKTIFK